ERQRPVLAGERHGRLDQRGTRRPPRGRRCRPLWGGLALHRDRDRDRPHAGRRGLRRHPRGVSMRAGFADRHLGPDAHDLERMLARVGAADPAALLAEALPAVLHGPDLTGDPRLPPALDESTMLAELREIAAANTVR